MNIPSTSEPSPAEPGPGIPLDTLRGTLTNRILNALLREGFTTVEEVATASDTTLLGISMMGWPSVNEIREVIAAAEADAYQVDGTEVLLDGAQVRELANLLSTLAVYADARQQTNLSHRARAFIEVLPLSKSTTP